MKTLYVAERNAWRAWLEEHYQTESEIWLIYPRVYSGKPRIPYNDAVEEALCFGWIDSLVRKLDADHSLQRYSPRRAKSTFSQTNIERLRRLVPAGRVLPAVVARLGDLLEREFEFPPDILAALQANERAWENFQRYSGAYQRIRIAYIDHGRQRPGELEKRLANFLKKTEQDKQFGYGIEAYY